MTHPILKDLRWRYTSKKYDPNRKVSEADLEILFEAMRLSASSINSQPWKFLVIESDAAKTRLQQTFADTTNANRAHVFESSHILLLAHNPRYTQADYEQVVEQFVADKRLPPEAKDQALASYKFAEFSTDATGFNGHWTKAQLYLALGNTLHTLARLRIDSTPIEGIDAEGINREFADELEGYRCEVALAIGYHHPTEDYNSQLPKSRLALNRILKRL